VSGIVIVGGAGFIGSALIKEMEAKDVLVFDNFSSIVHTRSSITDFLALGVDFIVGDATSHDDLTALFDATTPEVLVYLVAETGTGRSLFNIEMNARVNVLGLGMALDEMSRRDAFPKHVVIASTRAVYGEGPYQNTMDGSLVYPEQREKIALDEGRFEYDGMVPFDMNAGIHLPKPISVYGSTKLSQENILLNWARSFDIPCYAFRMQNVYGGGQSLSNPYTGVLIHFLNRLAASEDVLVYENGGITRDFVHVSDVARVFSDAISGEGKPGIYDIGSGVRSDLFDVAAELSDIAGGRTPEICDAYRQGDVRHACADISKVTEIFDWIPQIGLSDGLRDVYEFYKLKH